MKLNHNPYLKSKNKTNKRGDDNMLKKLFKQEKGFTMIELIIVIAIIAIIGAIVAPNFAKATTKSKVRADVASIREVNRQIALYMAEHGKYPGDDEKTKSDGTSNDTSNGGLSKLVSEGYLDTLPIPQTTGLVFSYDASAGKAIIIADNSPEPSDDVKKVIEGLSDSDKAFIASSLKGTADTSGGSEGSGGSGSEG